jgi:hypothetical protein
MEFEFLKSEAALESLVRRWQECTLPGPEFTHAAHLAACAWLTFDFRGEELAGVMKRGLIQFNEAAGTPNSADRGYHEMLTRFWCALVEKSAEGHATRLSAARAVVGTYSDDRSASDRCYSFNVLKSREARQNWIQPDMQEL